MHFRILKMIATSNFLTALECTKFYFGRGVAPDPACGACSARQTVWMVLGCPLLRGKGRERRAGRRGDGGTGYGEWKGRGRDAREKGGTPEDQGRILKMRSRYMKGSRDLLLKLWDPIHISKTSEAKNFKFGI